MQRERKEKPSSDPEASPGFWINRVSKALVRLGDGRLRPLGFAMSYLPVLRVLAMAKGPLSQTELAQAVGVLQPTMAETIARLVRDGMVVREPNPDDKRTSAISLTRKAHARFPKARVVLVDSEAEAMAGLSKDEKALLRHLLQRVFKNLETLSTAPPAHGDHPKKGAAHE